MFEENLLGTAISEATKKYISLINKKEELEYKLKRAKSEEKKELFEGYLKITEAAIELVDQKFIEGTGLLDSFVKKSEII